MKIDGSCHCGNITYEADVNPDKVYICHCTDCQSISGSPFRWSVSVPENNFKLLSGNPKTYIKKGDSGNVSNQLFCAECAAPLYSTSALTGANVIRLRLGTARQRDKLKPKLEAWCRSAQNWIEVMEDTQKLDTQ